MPKPTDSSTSAHNSKFREIERIRDPDGITAVITERISDGRISCRIVREFEQDGETKESSYFSSRHLPAIKRLIADMEESEVLELREDRARAKRRSAS